MSMENNLKKSQFYNLFGLLNTTSDDDLSALENSQKKVQNLINLKIQNMEDSSNLQSNTNLNSKPKQSLPNRLILPILGGLAVLSVVGVFMGNGLIQKNNINSALLNRLESSYGLTRTQIAQVNTTQMNFIESESDLAKLAVDSISSGNKSTLTGASMAFPVIQGTVDPKTLMYSCDKIIYMYSNGDNKEEKQIIKNCNFPNGSKYVLYSEDGKITGYNLYNESFTVEYLGGQYAVKILNEVNADGISKDVSVYSGSLNLEASILANIANLGLKPTRVDVINSQSYDVYLVPNSPIVGNVKLGMYTTDDVNSSPAVSEPGLDVNIDYHSLVYIHHDKGTLYKVEEYADDKIISSQELVENKMFNYDQAVAASKDFSDLSVEIRTLTIPQPPVVSSIPQTLTQFSESYVTLLPQGDDWIITNFYDSTEDFAYTPEFKEYLAKYNEFAKYMQDKAFNPYIDQFQTLEKELDTQSVTNETGVISPEFLRSNQLAQYSFSSVKNSGYMSVTIYDDKVTDYLRTYLGLADGAEISSEQFKIKNSGEKLPITIGSVTVDATFYELSREYPPVQSACANDGTDCTIKEPSIGMIQTVQVLGFKYDGKVYILNNDSKADLKNLKFEKITSNQINSFNSSTAETIKTPQ